MATIDDTTESLAIFMVKAVHCHLTLQIYILKVYKLPLAAILYILTCMHWCIEGVHHVGKNGLV